jgi:hypothetical protein
MKIMFCKLEHMCYLNVQAAITTKNAYWLFVTIKKTLKKEFFQMKIAQSKYEMIIDLGFWKTPYIVTFPG